MKMENCEYPPNSKNLCKGVVYLCKGVDVVHLCKGVVYLCKGVVQYSEIDYQFTFFNSNIGSCIFFAIECILTSKDSVETQPCFVICRIIKFKSSVISIISSLTSKTRMEVSLNNCND